MDAVLTRAIEELPRLQGNKEEADALKAALLNNGTKTVKDVIALKVFDPVALKGMFEINAMRAADILALQIRIDKDDLEKCLQQDLDAAVKQEPQDDLASTEPVRDDRQRRIASKMRAKKGQQANGQEAPEAGTTAGKPAAAKSAPARPPMQASPLAPLMKASAPAPPLAKASAPAPQKRTTPEGPSTQALLEGAETAGERELKKAKMEPATAPPTQIAAKDWRTLSVSASEKKEISRFVQGIYSRKGKTPVHIKEGLVDGFEVRLWKAKDAWTIATSQPGESKMQERLAWNDDVKSDVPPQSDWMCKGDGDEWCLDKLLTIEYQPTGDEAQSPDEDDKDEMQATASADPKTPSPKRSASRAADRCTSQIKHDKKTTTPHGSQSRSRSRGKASRSKSQQDEPQVEGKDCPPAERELAEAEDMEATAGAADATADESIQEIYDAIVPQLEGDEKAKDMARKVERDLGADALDRIFQEALEKQNRGEVTNMKGWIHSVCKKRLDEAEKRLPSGGGYESTRRHSFNDGSQRRYSNEEWHGTRSAGPSRATVPYCGVVQPNISKKKGFGFIKPTTPINGTEQDGFTNCDVFFHASSSFDGKLTFDAIEADMKVQFNVDYEPTKGKSKGKGKGKVMIAKNVRLAPPRIPLDAPLSRW